MLEHTSGMCIV